MGSFDHEECMKIVQCDIFAKNIISGHEDLNCWDMARQMKDFRFLYNICNECIVYLFAQKEKVFSAKEVEKILTKRNITCYRTH